MLKELTRFKVMVFIAPITLFHCFWGEWQWPGLCVILALCGVISQQQSNLSQTPHLQMSSWGLSATFQLLPSTSGSRPTLQTGSEAQVLRNAAYQLASPCTASAPFIQLSPTLPGRLDPPTATNKLGNAPLANLMEATPQQKFPLPRRLVCIKLTNEPAHSPFISGTNDSDSHCFNHNVHSLSHEPMCVCRGWT